MASIHAGDEQLLALPAKPGDEPMVMLNMLRYRDVVESGYGVDGMSGEDAYREYGPRFAELSPRFGGEPRRRLPTPASSKPNSYYPAADAGPSGLVATGGGVLMMGDRGQPCAHQLLLGHQLNPACVLHELLRHQDGDVLVMDLAV